MILPNQATENQGTVPGTKGGVALTGSLLNSSGCWPTTADWLFHHYTVLAPLSPALWGASCAVWDRDTGSKHLQQCHTPPRGWFRALPQGCCTGECKGATGLCRLEEVRLSAVRSLLARITGVSNLPKKIQLCQGGVHRRGARQRQMWMISSAVSPVWSLC